MKVPLGRRDVVGLIKPAVDAHTLGVSMVAQLLTDCGIAVVTADSELSLAVEQPDDPGGVELLERWLREHHITRLGFSYRLDAPTGAGLFQRWLSRLADRRLLAAQGGPLAAVYFAGLPAACALVQRRCGSDVEVFAGDETPGETLDRMGVPAARRPPALSEATRYDEARLRFGRDLLAAGKHLEVKPVDRSGYPEFGTAQDSLLLRLRHGREHGLPPLMRAHLGQYGPDRGEAVRGFLEHARQLAHEGLLDILSIGTSQLSQSAFGQEWGGRSNGGGVPINTPDEFRAAWRAARPMLVRTYAGTRDIPRLARLYEESLNTAWHALSFWWFSRLDGRGPYELRQNLEQHFTTLKVVASAGKPFEPNVPHHFAFRGADDVTCVVAGVLAARAARAAGIRHLVLQVMLNTPKGTWGVQDLARARALLTLVRQLENRHFRVTLQPRAGLDYFSPDLGKARVQLAAVTALMADIAPEEPRTPEVVHVVSYSEASHLADPGVVDESIQITRAALAEYRRHRARGEVEDMAQNPDVQQRTGRLLAGAGAILGAIDEVVPHVCSPAGFYASFAAGFLPVPWLWACRDEFPLACRWTTRLVAGSVEVVDQAGAVIPADVRARQLAEEALAARLPG